MKKLLSYSVLLYSIYSRRNCWIVDIRTEILRAHDHYFTVTTLDLCDIVFLDQPAFHCLHFNRVHVSHYSTMTLNQSIATPVWIRNVTQTQKKRGTNKLSIGFRNIKTFTHAQEGDSVCLFMSSAVICQYY